MKLKLYTLALLSSVASCAYAGTLCTNNCQTVPDSIKQIMQQPRYNTARFGLCVTDLTSNKVLYSMHPNKIFVPASVSKLFTVATLLNAFGDDYTFKTPVYALGKITNGTLDGNLVLVGTGDLTLGGRVTTDNKIAFTSFDHIYANTFPGYSSDVLTPQDPLAGIKSLAAQVKANGITTIHGNVFIDDRLFETKTKRDSVLNPVVINENLIDFTFKPTQSNQKATVDWRPQIPQIRVINHVTTVAAGGDSDIDVAMDSKGDYIASGTIASDKKQLILTANIENPKQFAQDAFVAALEQAGVTITANPLAATGLPNTSVYNTLKPVAEFTSPPILETAKLILKVSHNMGANLSALLIASHHGKTGYNQGLGYIGQFLMNVVKISPSDISFGDAAGGDENYVTPSAVVKLLNYEYHLPKQQFENFVYTLPILGVDGSLASVATTSPAKGHVFAKTGAGVIYNALQNSFFLTSRALAGYVQAKNGHWLAFIVVVNNAALKNIMDVEDVSKDIANISAEIYNTSN